MAATSDSSPLPPVSVLGFLEASMFYLIFPFVFSLLVVPDIVKAFKKRAHWVPGNTLALSALTIQAISFFSFFRVFQTRIEMHKGYKKNVTLTDESEDYSHLLFLFHRQMMIDFGRLDICVFIGYILPNIEISRSAKTLKLILALVICLVPQIFSEFYYMQSHSNLKARLKKHHHESDMFWFSLSRNIFYFSIIFLIFLLVCTVIAGKTLCGILNKRIAAILSVVNEVEGSEIISPSPEDPECQKTEGPRAWKDFENEVFKSWIVGRVCQPDYVIARSVLSSAVGLVVTICVVFSVFKSVWLARHYRHHHFRPFHGHPHGWLFYYASWPFSMVGWIVICWRWFEALFYFSRLKLRGGFWILFRMEEFWTRSIVELIHVCDEVDRQSIGLLTRIVVNMRLHKLLHILKGLQILLVLVSKSCQLLSEMLILAPFLFVMSWLQPGSSVSNLQGEQGVSTSALNEELTCVLKRVCMPGEDPASLWEANVSAIKQIKLFMKKGHENGSQCKNLISHSDGFCQQWIEEGFRLIDELKRKRLPRVHNYFPHLDKPSWKMTAVSLLHIIAQLERNNYDRLKTAVKEAWDVMNLVDNARVGDQMLNLMGDIAGSDLGFGSDIASAYEVQVSIAADKEFSKLQLRGESLEVGSVNVKASSHRDQCMQMRDEAAAALKVSKLLVDDQKEKDADFELHDAIDWMKIAPQYSLYRLCRVIEELPHSTDPDLAHWAENSLKNILACCLSRLPNILVKYSRQCAQEFQEDNLWETIYLAGKVRGLMEKLGVPRLQPSKERIEMEWRLC